MIDWWFIGAFVSIAVYFIVAIWYMLFLRYFNMNALTMPTRGVPYDANDTDKRRDYNLLCEHINYVIRQHEVQHEDVPREINKLRKHLLKQFRKED